MGKQPWSITLAVARKVAFVISLAWALPANAGPGWQFSDWSAPVNLGPVVNSAGTDQGPAISKDELELYFVREVGGFGLGDLWVSTRKHKKDPWGPPQNLGPTINTSARESLPALSRDGFLLYFSSSRPGGCGGFDIWVSARIDTRDPLGWQEPMNLGCDVNGGPNSAAGDLGPAIFEDRKTGTVTLYFYSTRPRDPDDLTPDRDIYASILGANGSFGPAVLVPELSTPSEDEPTPFEDEQPSIRRDGLEMFFASNRPGGFGGSDIWVSTRASTSDPWLPPVNLGSVINTAALEARPALSFDARSLYFFSNGHGGFGSTDLFVSTRKHVGDDEDDGDDDDGDDE